MKTEPKDKRGNILREGDKIEVTRTSGTKFIATVKQDDRGHYVYENDKGDGWFFCDNNDNIRKLMQREL